MGEVVGIDHLGEDQRNSITNLNTLLRTHAAEVKCHHCQDASGADKTLCLIYSALRSNRNLRNPRIDPEGVGAERPSVLADEPGSAGSGAAPQRAARSGQRRLVPVTRRTTSMPRS